MTSQHKTGAHPFYIGMYIHIYTHIYVHKNTSQKECLHIFCVTICTYMYKYIYIYICHMYTAGLKLRILLFGRTQRSVGTIKIENGPNIILAQDELGHFVSPFPFLGGDVGFSAKLHGT